MNEQDALQSISAEQPYPIAVSTPLEHDYAELCETIRICAKMQIDAKSQ